MEKRYAILKSGDFETREGVNEAGEKEMVISGYFARFDDIYDYGYGVTESIDPNAFHLERDKDVRVLTDHDSKLVLGRTTAGTAELFVDSVGLGGRVLINPKDQDAVNTWARVERRDVTQCSFGFDILSEQEDVRADGTVHYTLKDVKLYEVSVCTFPAYEGTSIEARHKDAESLKKRTFEAWKKGIAEKHEWLKEA